MNDALLTPRVILVVRGLALLRQINHRTYYVPLSFRQICSSSDVFVENTIVMNLSRMYRVQQLKRPQ